MNLKNIGLLLSTSAFYFGCISSSVKTEQLTDKETANTESINQAPLTEATFFGITPCPDCRGIKTNVSLAKDFSYEISYDFLGKETDTVFETGTWKLNKNVITLTSEDGSIKNYIASDKELIILNKEGRKYSADLAPKYILKRI